MEFDKYFRACSYAMIACGVLALAVSGGVGVWLAGLFAAMLFASWKLSGTRWQLSERAGMFVVLLALPAFYLDWSFQRAGMDAAGQVYAGVSALVHFTLLLTSIKLFQVKSDRDWLFLYLISFFEVLLAAGLSVSPAFMLSLGLYVFAALLAIVCFELRRAARVAPEAESRLLVANDAKLLRRGGGLRRRGGKARATRRLPAAALCLFLLIFALALPIFLITPRSTENVLAMSGGVASTGFVGFSDQVRLGDIGRLQESNQLVMRVRVEGRGASGARPLRWRGVALDRFDGRRWTQSAGPSSGYQPFEGNLFQLGKTVDLGRLTTQTFFVEPIDTPVIFGAPRAVALGGAFPYVRRDRDDGLSTRPHPLERITYTVYSDTVEPPPELLRADRTPDPSNATANFRRPAEDYLQLPADMDTRIGSLAWTIMRDAGARNRYDTARAIEAHLNQNAYGGGYRYTLDMRATGREPLADFLFNVRAGHCEYFSTAMAVMLRTLRIPARVVNGFQTGEYNAAADAYTVRQADAHSWVEVYFPETDSWVTFDPTPADGRPAGTSGTGLAGSLRRYADAFELFWIQHVVAYDRQGQRTLARAINNSVTSYRIAASEKANGLNESLSAWWAGRGGGPAAALGVVASPPVLASASLLFVAAAVVWLRRKGLFSFRRGAKKRGADASVVEFYERMIKALEARGLRRRADETPLEFAVAVGTPEVHTITLAYNLVRFGARPLSKAEADEVERSLKAVTSDR